ncbi:threonine dehydratase [Propionibacteriaceae bacterium ES.041]|uniref:pyridoxal-phosphate dependent enzyme n=1 Tax=Enemella evansiae TaxID=2016499 RepID=UPI000B96C56D|nr:pyridoxal-phosphate dependent enzyme [Enemella evansiae]OYO08221.1 pyridoxal-5'-phosphate-dependent protein subunit beta [Enemella evansiae]OYO18977.1 pyridoxal-5'-phosphate-dependent protein subunit beta [Enemella evansiae]PFG68096.1 threonine dehydratase [Propionibacteriaceae bacterium ES.041]TDO86234.1 threonine dehydratase [Enemella evansiae]
MDFDDSSIRQAIPAVFLDSPQFEDPLLSAALGVRVTLKVETLNPLRSFKGRGVSFALRDLTPGETVVCASSGNFGQAVAYAAAARGAAARVYAHTELNPVKRERMAAFGATVIEVAEGFDAARERAAAEAEGDGVRLIVDGVDPAIAEGAATIAHELAAAEFDTLVAPIGDGSLVTGLALGLRAYAPNVRIVGVNPATAPTMRESWRAGRPIAVRPTSALAEGITIPRPHPEALTRVTDAVDDIVLVSDAELRTGMALIERHLALRAEPAGAAGIAAIAAGRTGGERIATIITGANRNPAMGEI